MGCATTPTVRHGDEASTDLQIIRLGIEALTEPREVAGPIQHREQAATNGELWLLSGRQEDALQLAEGDKRRARTFVLESLGAIEKARQAVDRKWYEFWKPKKRGDPR